MQTLLAVWNFVSLASIIAFPQLVGVLLYYKLTWARRSVAAIIAALAPAVLFFLLARIILVARLRVAFPEPRTCGGPVLAALFAMYVGTIIQMVLGVITQVVLSRRRS